MTSETTRMAEAQLLAELEGLRWEVEKLREMLADSVPKSLLTREQLLEVAVRQHLADAPVVRTGSGA